MNDDNQTHADEAFEQAAIGYEFQGKPLFAFSGSREVAAQRMGMRAPGLSEEDIETLRSGHFYKGQLQDVIILMWLCSTKNASELTADEVKAKAWTVQRARNNPEQAYEAAEKWAASCGLTSMTGDAFAEASMTMFAMFRNISAAEFRLEIEGGNQTGESEPGKV